MKISLFIFLGFIIILSMFTMTTYINFRLSEQVNENHEWLAKSTIVIRASNRFQRNTLNMQSSVRGFLFTGEESFIQAYDSATNENNSIVKELHTHLPERSGQHEALDKIAAIQERWKTEFAIPLMTARRHSYTSDSSMEAFNQLYRGKLRTGVEAQILNQQNTFIRNFINHEYNVREMRKVALENSIRETANVSLLLTTFSILTGLGIAVFLAYRISTRIMKMVSMADDIAGGNYQAHTEDSGKDELSRLAKSLNHMAEVLSRNISLLQRKNTELNQFAHIVSHDMKAPLRGIDNVVTWIEEDHYEELPLKVKEYIGLIKSRIIRGENLINGILSYSRVGQYEVEKEEVSLSALLQEVTENIPVRPGIKLTISPDLPTIFTQRVPLMQVFTNLIGNAVKYHDKADGNIKVYHEEHENYYTFFIEDNGPGIAQHYHEKIFQIFQTLNGVDSFENTGVGLAIVKKILEDRHQQIKLVSEPGAGSVFSFTWSK